MSGIASFPPRVPSRRAAVEPPEQKGAEGERGDTARGATERLGGAPIPLRSRSDPATTRSARPPWPGTALALGGLLLETGHPWPSSPPSQRRTPRACSPALASPSPGGGLSTRAP